jgi:methionyl-tRNA formyltransferase
VVFFGTSEFAVPSLQRIAQRFDTVRVITQPDRPRGRGQKVEGSPVARAAAELNLEILRPETLKAPGLAEEITALKPDLFAVVAFGMILPKRWLEIPKQGALNLHGSLLPEYRGAAPVQRALWDGRSGSGVTTMFMDEGVDTGDRVFQRWEPIHPEDNAGTLGSRLATIGAPLFAETLALAATGAAPRWPQAPNSGSYAGKMKKEDGLIDWTLDAVTVWNRQRAVTPWPGAQTMHRERRLTVTVCRPWQTMEAGVPPGTVLAETAHGVVVACGSGAVELMRVKPEGKAEMDAADWTRGARVQSGERMAKEEAAT